MNKEDCQKCRKCCNFKKDETQFAPLFTDNEKRGKKAKFKPYNGIFQIKLVKSNGKYVCPLLDEATHLCKIYEKRPFDCRIWPFIFMKKKSSIVLACFDKKICPSIAKMSKKEFNAYKKETMDWLEKEDIINFIKDNKGLIWDYEKDTFIIKNIK